MFLLNVTKPEPSIFIQWVWTSGFNCMLHFTFRKMSRRKRSRTLKLQHPIKRLKLAVCSVPGTLPQPVFAQAKLEHMMAVLKQRKGTSETSLCCPQELERGHALWVSPKWASAVSISCWTPLNSLSCFPAWACHTEACYSVCTGDLTHRMWKLWVFLRLQGAGGRKGWNWWWWWWWEGSVGGGWNRICWE